ncbi:hypothetical protein [Dokdonella soli]|uniref:Tetratricopeptide repeat protein n=1 Tax=Dokdonella soli TaxID=529810 RepID=A0ABN1IDT9_9GAMM
MTVATSSFDQRFATAVRLADDGHLPQAIEIFAALAHERPELAPLRHALVRGLLLAGDPDRAHAEANHPILLDAREAFRAVVADFAAAGALHQRGELLRAFLQRHPDDYDAALALAAAAHLLGRPSDALRWSEHALALRPQQRMPREIRAASLIDRGDVEAGLAGYRELLRHGDAETAARHLVLMHYDPAQDNEILFAAHRDFAQRHLHAFGPPPIASACDPEQPLRIGWLSPRIAAGPVATFLDGLLARFDRSRHRHLLISLEPAQDAAGRRLQTLVEEAVDASGLDDARLLQRLRALQLDVLVDLAGHSTGNRLAVLAQRVAPVQVCWLDWFDTTAVPAMDAWFSDAWLTPADSTQRYSERVVRLASGRFCYTPLDDAPSPLHDGAGPPVYASFNRLAKLNDGVIDAWADILRRVPESRLELRARHLGEPETRAHIAQRFAERGVDAARLQLGGELPYQELLAAYRRIDVALDPFPFSGCTTTCDALWMGCPVVTLPGATFVSRQSASLLWRLGRDEWVARSRDDYVACAARLAVDPGALRADRAGLRDTVRAQLCDANAQAADFAAALRGLWQAQCARL